MTKTPTEGKRVGGKRPGAGRKLGSATRKTREVADRAIKEGLTPLEYMLRVLRDEEADPVDRRWAAEKAAPYVHPKLASIEHSGAGGGPLQIVISAADAEL